MAYIGEDPALADEEREREMAAMEALGVSKSPDTSMEDAGQWNPNMTLEEMQAHARARQLQQQQQYRGTPVPAAFLSGGVSPQPVQQPSPPEQHSLHHSSSRERMKLMDPLEAHETRKVSVTPSVARGDDGAVGPVSLGSNNPFLTNANLERERQQQQQQQQQEAVLRAKRRAEEEAAAAEEARKRSKSSAKDTSARAASPVSSSSSHASGGKLRKDPSSRDKDKSRDTDSEESGGSTKKKGGIFRIFGKRDKDKDKNKVERGGSIGSLGSFISQDSTEKDSSSRLSEDSSRSGHGLGHRNAGSISGSVDIVIQPQQPAQQRLSPQFNAQSSSPQQQYQQQQQSQPQYSTTPAERPTAISSHATQLRQRDQQQQALYQQYLNRSPSSGPETQPSYGLQSASALVSSSTFRGSPGPAVTPSAATGSNAASNANLHTNANANSTHPPPTSTSASASAPTARQRPGSLILIPGMAGIDGQSGGGQGLPDLSVMRVFAGRNLQTEATFKTVLLSSSTTAAELVKQAIQRFRLPEASGGGGGTGGGEGSGGTGVGGAMEGVASAGAAAGGGSEYYLTVKRVEGGGSAVLRPHEKPLVVFESLVLQALQDEAMDAAENLPPRVKRSSILSISSVASNLSMHPAIRKLPMNDFTDDSAVKFYLNRRASGERDSAGAASIGGLLSAGTGSLGDGESSDAGSLRYRLFGDDDEMEEHTLIAEMSQDEGDASITSTSSAGNDIASMFSKDGRYLGIAAIMANVTPERFSSPSLRFALQLVIHPSDLPDDMVFHPFTEAIVPKDTLSTTSPGPTSPSASFRRKVFMFPKNVTVAEVIELGLERFGILEGVVDGGDEVEDKLVKRRSSSRVRYGLHVDIGHGPGMSTRD